MSYIWPFGVITLFRATNSIVKIKIVLNSHSSKFAIVHLFYVLFLIKPKF